MLRYLIENSFQKQNKKPSNLYCTVQHCTDLSSEGHCKGHGEEGGHDPDDEDGDL